MLNLQATRHPAKMLEDIFSIFYLKHFPQCMFRTWLPAR